MQKTELDQQHSHYVFFSLFVLMKYVAIQRNFLRVISGILSIPLKYSGESSGLQYYLKFSFLPQFKSNSMILLLVFGPRPQWLMNFARSLLKLTRGETLILSHIRRVAECNSPLNVLTALNGFPLFAMQLDE